MELLLYAAVFTLWQCAKSLPRDAAAIVSFCGRRALRRGPGWLLFSPWPGDLACVFEAADAADAFSLAGFRRAFASTRRATLVLRLACDAYVLGVFAAVPAGIAWLEGEAAWRLLLPLLGVLHFGTLTILLVTERRLEPRPGGRLERWLGSALFPPALFRTPADLLAQRLAGFHPATAAAALLEEGAFVRALRREIGRLPPDAPAREPMLGLCEQLAIDRGRVLAPPRVSPAAESYCPRCLDEFRVARGRCGGCGVDSVAYAPGARASEPEPTGKPR